MGKKRKAKPKTQEPQEQWYVEVVVAARRDMRRSRGENIYAFDLTHDGWLYEIKWADWPHAANTWEPVGNLKGEGCEGLLRRFWQSVDQSERTFMINDHGFLVFPSESYLKEEELRFAQLTPQAEVAAQNANPRRDPYERISIQRMTTKHWRTAPTSESPPAPKPILVSTRSSTSTSKTQPKALRRRKSATFAPMAEVSEITGIANDRDGFVDVFAAGNKSIRNTAQHNKVYTTPTKKHGPGSFSSSEQSGGDVRSEEDGSASASDSDSAAALLPVLKPAEQEQEQERRKKNAFPETSSSFTLNFQPQDQAFRTHASASFGPRSSMTLTDINMRDDSDGPILGPDYRNDRDDTMDIDEPPSSQLDHEMLPISNLGFRVRGITPYQQRVDDDDAPFMQFGSLFSGVQVGGRDHDYTEDNDTTMNLLGLEEMFAASRRDSVEL
ncbi:hypothetical protein C8F01DRAFT_1376175 [Mycena amicta]|nr:hypothetical protein C8F01DRAFT_1376175 [Mycena amicta]